MTQIVIRYAVRTTDIPVYRNTVHEWSPDGEIRDAEILYDVRRTYYVIRTVSVLNYTAAQTSHPSVSAGDSGPSCSCVSLVCRRWRTVALRSVTSYHAAHAPSKCRAQRCDHARDVALFPSLSALTFEPCPKARVPLPLPRTATGPQHARCSKCSIRFRERDIETLVCGLALGLPFRLRLRFCLLLFMRCLASELARCPLCLVPWPFPFPAERMNLMCL